MSQPGLTPLGLSGLHEDILGIKSPDANVIASLNATGLTSLPTGQDGLGISTSLQVPNAATTRNPEAERIHNLQQVLGMLRPRIAGYGITRDGVERVAQLQGFTTLWDAETLTVAGNSVDLEITFDTAQHDLVQGVALKLPMVGGEEPQLQKEASNILKQDLFDDGASADYGPWKSLNDFKNNLERLGRLDRADTNTNCFELVSDLYNTLQKIWCQEKARLNWRSELHHICRGNMGRPSMDRGKKLGLSLTYWTTKHITNERLGLEDSATIWDAHLSCEAGTPSIAKDREWLSTDILLNAEMTDTSKIPEDESMKPDWRDPVLDVQSEQDIAQADPDTMDVDKPMPSILETLNVRYICDLAPKVLLPLETVLSLDALVPQLDQAQTVTYEQALRDARNAKAAGQNVNLIAENRWTRSVDIYSKSGQRSTASHSYALRPPSGALIWFYPVSRLAFSHPRQLASVLPILRQYALLWDLLRTMVEVQPPFASVPPNAATEAPSSIKAAPRTKTRSNRKPEQTVLQGLLRPAGPASLPIDMTLDVLSDATKAQLHVFIALPEGRYLALPKRFIHMKINVGLNGVIDVEELNWVTPENDDKWRRRVAKNLTLSEDLGYVIEWLLRELRNSTST